MSCIMRLTLALGFFSAAAGQQAGDAKKEVHLPMPIQHCTKALGCKFEDATVVLDSNWRWTHELGCTNSSKCNCFLGNQWVNATCQGVDDCSHVRLAHFGPRNLVGLLELQRCTFPPPYSTPKRRVQGRLCPPPHSPFAPPSFSSARAEMRHRRRGRQRLQGKVRRDR